MSSINIEKIGIVHWYPNLERHKCGYCKNENGAVSYGMWAEQLTVEDYQNLIDRGWRRSGMYCYKPVMDQTCCPQYSIKCKALEFQPSKSQKKIIKKFNKFLSDGVVPKSNTHEGNVSIEESDEPIEHMIIKERPKMHIDISKETSISSKTPIQLGEIEDHNMQSGVSSASLVVDDIKNDLLDVTQESTKDEKVIVCKEGVGADPTKPPCKKAKLLRLEKRQQKLLQRGMSLEKNPKSNNAPKHLEQFLNELPDNVKDKLKIELVSTIKIQRELEEIKNIEFELYKKYQMIVHNDPPEKCSINGFTRFLISSPLMSVRVRGDTSGSVTFGTFHQQYWLDNKLIAVGVLDILPRCISSVYFFYDPDYRFLTLGTYGALRELQFVQSLQRSIPTIEYYYMGFYIHSCQKMRYKGKLSHSYLLCPETYKWFPLEKCIPKVTVNKYSRLNDDNNAVDEDLCTVSDVDRIKVCVSYSFTVFGNYKRKYGEQEVFDNIGKLIGKKCASTLLFVCSK